MGTLQICFVGEKPRGRNNLDTSALANRVEKNWLIQYNKITASYCCLKWNAVKAMECFFKRLEMVCSKEHLNAKHSAQRPFVWLLVLFCQSRFKTLSLIDKSPTFRAEESWGFQVYFRHRGYLLKMFICCLEDSGINRHPETDLFFHQSWSSSSAVTNASVY